MRQVLQPLLALGHEKGAIGINPFVQAQLRRLREFLPDFAVGFP
jgi:hypothetical protein